MLSSGCQAHRMEAWGERKTRGVTTAGWSGGGGLCVDSMRQPPANRILDMFIETASAKSRRRLLAHLRVSFFSCVFGLILAGRWMKTPKMMACSRRPPSPTMMMTVRVSRSVYRLQKCGKSRSPCISLFFHLRPMSSNAIAKLPSPLKDLVTASVADSSVSSETKPEVNKWIEKVASGQFGKAESLKVQIHRRLAYGHG